MIFILATLIAVSVYMYFYRITKDAINPFGVSILIYMIMYGLSTLNLSIYQTEMLMRTHIMCCIPMVSIFVIGCYYCNKYQHVYYEEKFPVVTSNYRRLMWIIAFIALVSVVYLLLTRGVRLELDFSQSGTLNTRKGEIAEQMYSGAGLIGKGAQLFPYTMVFLAYDLIFNDKNTFFSKCIESCYCIFCVLYSLFVLASRGTLLLSILALLYLINKKYHFRAKTIAILLFGVLMAFTFYMGLRVIKESIVFSGTSIANRTFNSVYNYFALSFNNFDQLVRHGSPYTGIQYCLISLSKLLGIYNESEILRFQTSIFNSASFIYGFYHDLGIIGVILWPIVIYIMIGKIYILSKNKRPELVLLLGMFGKAMFVLSFGNYFFGSISQEIQTYFCLMLLIYGYRFRQMNISFGSLCKNRIKFQFTVR